ncbi:FAD-binding oxidoreductase [Levilactobacillus namurensis]|uniref:FAD-linked oxidase C-terminal domain-containing protein n=1 Tax=Levilactobacillus namurensis TaxID=380393 RepID=A0AAW8W2Q9_9LACO|nr:FAD-linked oxidase C-terminal domain-containing protein [Levilactobacillus namurensis]MDT7013059.1 FAD-linked oxidase C-terminal domain-containing protein [Levilactobacillus namurensis]
MTVFSAFSDEEILTFLKQQVTDGTVTTDPQTLRQQSFNGNATGGEGGLARAFVEVGSVADIQGVLKTARKFHLAVVPQTTATSTVVGSDGITGAIILSTRKMNRILEISKDDSLAVVQPGVVNGDLDQTARKQGLFYAPDPGSKPFSSIGGNVSTNAGGMSTVRYGATKDNVLGLKAVLADGRTISLGGRTLKQAFGYDLTQLFVGSEGTLGIIYEVTVKLLPIPLGQSIMGMAFFENMGKLAKGVAAIRMSGVNPTMLEALDGNTVVALDRYEKTHYAENSGAMLIFRLDGSSDQNVQVLQDLLTKYDGQHVQVTADTQQQADLEQLRRDMLPAVFAGRNHLMEDMALPLSQLAPMMDYLQDLSQRLGVMIYTAGHAGDGNVHPTFVWDKAEDQVPAAVLEALRQAFRKTLELGGTISGEHAVGMMKNQWNNPELGDNVDYLQHQIKTLFDPMNILNPKRKID